MRFRLRPVLLSIFAIGIIATVNATTRKTTAETTAYDFTQRQTLQKRNLQKQRLFIKRSFSYQPASGLLNTRATRKLSPTPAIRGYKAPSEATLFGCMIANSSWSWNDKPVGIYSIDPNTANCSMLVEAAVLDEGSAAGTYANGKFYASVLKDFYGYISSLKNITIDLSSGKIEIYEYPAPEYSDAAVNMTYDAVNNIIYTINYGETTDEYTLCTFDPQTNEYSRVGYLENHYWGICVDGSGKLYAVNDNGDVVNINKQTAMEDGIVASTGFTPSYLQSCCWSPTDGRIYWAAYNDTQSRLIAIDPVTGETSSLVDFSNEEEFIGLYCTDPVADKKAPAVCTDVTVEYIAPGSTVANISCVLPTKTVDGNRLTGTVSLSLKSDQHELSTSGALTPGDKWFGQYDLGEGIHTLEIICSNLAGKGIPASLKTFAGEDSPAKVTGLTATKTDDTTVRLSWNAPESGINGGWFDTERLSYTITRNGEKIAEAVKTTDYTDHLSDELAAYSYTVDTYYDNLLSASTASETVICGNYVYFPYSQLFNTLDCVGLLSVIDNNHDSTTWFLDNEQGKASYQYSETNNADDYLVLPRMKFEEDHVYTISFEAHSTSATWPEKMEVVTGDNPNAASLTNIIMPPAVIPQTATEYSLDYTAISNGYGHIAFHCVSDADMSTLYLDNVYVNDAGHILAPKAPDNLVVTADPDGELTAVIDFTTPSTDYSGNKLTNLSKIEISRNGDVIHTFDNPKPETQLHYTDNNARQGFNTYSITAYKDDLVGQSATAKIFIGTYTLPFSIQPTEEEFELFTTVDNNNFADDEWYYDTESNALKFVYSPKDADDYIFTPVIELGTTNLIELKFDVCVSYDTEVLEISYGKTTDPADQTAVKRYELNNREFETQTVTFDVPDKGRYYIGFRALSPARSTFIKVRDIRIDNGSFMLAPAAVTDLKATPGQQGALTADISFKIPRLSLNGNPLSGNVEIRATRADGSEVGTLTGFADGSEHSIIDNNAIQGNNRYILTAYNSFGEGAKAETSCYCGIDIPNEVLDLKATPSADNMQATLLWNAPTTGVHGGWFGPEDLTYRIYQLYNNALYKIGETKRLTYTVTSDDGVQDYNTYYVTASTLGGDSGSKPVGVVLGSPEKMPLIETASNGIVTTYPLVTGSTEGNVNWGISGYIYINSFEVAPPDGGMFVCYSSERTPGAARMQLPKLTLEGHNAPTLTFTLYHYATTGASISIKATTDEINYKEIFAKAINTTTTGWTEYQVNLSEYKDAQWLALIFDGTLENGNEYILIDDIEVSNQSEYDAAITAFTGIRRAEIGKPAGYTVEVTNKGKQPINYDFNFTVNGNVIETHSTTTPLTAGKTETYRLQYIPVPEDIASGIRIEADIIPCGWTDEIPDNNHVEGDAVAIQPALRVVTDLAATAGKNGSDVVLSWTAPTQTADKFTDDFEDYESFSYENIGDYTLVDGDGLTPCGIFGVTFPNMGTPMAFQVWEPEAQGVDVDAEIWRPRSGQKCLIAWTSLDQTDTPYNDDWLISPELYNDPAGPTFSFYAKMPVVNMGPETFEVLYSATEPKPEAFTTVTTVTLTSGGWKFYEYTLPEEARYFAIRYISRDKFALLIDDLTYSPQTAGNNLQILGYNLYRNGQKINGSTVIDATTATDTPTGNATYNVTVVYDQGESLMSNTASVISSGIAAATAGEIRISTADNRIIIANACGYTLKIATPEGRSIIAIPQLESEETSVTVAPGIYLVTVNTTTVKVLVR